MTRRCVVGEESGLGGRAHSRGPPYTGHRLCAGYSLHTLIRQSCLLMLSASLRIKSRNFLRRLPREKLATRKLRPWWEAAYISPAPIQ